jgi:hypothetical protein
VSETADLALAALGPVFARRDALIAEQEQVVARALEIAVELRVMEMLAAAVKDVQDVEATKEDQPEPEPNDDNGNGRKPKSRGHKSKGVSEYMIARVLHYLRDHDTEDVGSTELMEALHTSRETVNRSLEILRVRHMARKVGRADGKGRAMLWSVMDAE